ncbi:MAG: AsnC family transcriptional regulator, partial [Desulfurococcales archaeon ex4484_58]
MSVSDDYNYKLLSSIARNCRVNISNIARETGLHYISIKKRLERLSSRGLFDVKPLVSIKLSGTIGALIKLKTKNKSKILELLSQCNRVLGVVELNNEIVAIVYGKNKLDVIEIINKISALGDGLDEFSIEYGRIPPNLMVPIRNIDSCIFLEDSSCRNCLPSLSLKGNGFSHNKRS